MQWCISSNSMVLAQPQLHRFLHQEIVLSCECCRSCTSSRWLACLQGWLMSVYFNVLLLLKYVIFTNPQKLSILSFIDCIVGIHPFHHHTENHEVDKGSTLNIILLDWICFAICWHTMMTKIRTKARQFAILPLRQVWNQDNQLWGCCTNHLFN